MTNPDDAARAASASTRGPWPPEFTGVPHFTAPTGPIAVTYTEAPRIGAHHLSTQEAREMMAHLLAQFEDEADHAAENVKEWGPGPNQQTKLWQQQADEKRVYAAALRVILGLPERQPTCEECEAAPADFHGVDGWMCAGCAGCADEIDPPYEG